MNYYMFFFTNSKIYVLILKHIHNIKTVCSLYKLLNQLYRILCTFIIISSCKMLCKCVCNPALYLSNIKQTKKKKIK